MTDLTRKIGKYAIALAVDSLFGLPWFYLRVLLSGSLRHDSLVDLIPQAVDIAVRLLVVVLLAIDFKKNDLRHAALVCIAALLYPVLGVVLFAILLIERGRQIAVSRVLMATEPHSISVRP